MELAQIRLMVSDFPAVYRFYRDVLGLKPQFEAESGPYAKLSPDTGHAAIALQDRAQMAEVLGKLAAEPEGYRVLVVLRVDDLDAAHAELTSRGGGVHPGPGPDGRSDEGRLPGGPGRESDRAPGVAGAARAGW
ncbi:VOC family protein [Actinomadura xylanilytica]|uniref:VOC family protein n=1 Tax=Actinomadura xylanilytica TaxID=887459 RepID=UPI00255AE4F7|nr:VOC family protein [Actinomadura xylanilytica]MDL4772057.1 VOC family protein [Actinomadura xylanilytica]